MKRNIDVLSFLIEKNREMVNISRISKELNIDYKNAHGIVRSLAKQGLISLEKFGKTINCVLNKKTHPLIFEAEYGRREELIKNKNFRVLYEKLDSIPFAFISLVFGSYAKYKPDKTSDIDLMIICENNRRNIIENEISLLPLKIHIIALTYEEFLNMAKSKEFSVVSEAIGNNIIIIGIENYYRLIKNVG